MSSQPPNSTPLPLFGALNIDKPAGLTSHDVVSHARKLFTTHYSLKVKTGHSGTLDPFATGVLLILLGPATRLMEYILLLPKTYLAELTLGATSDTDDPDGKITKTQNTNSKQITRTQITKTLNTFIGTIKQIPPAYSAIKLKGKKLYQYAREGQTTMGNSMPPRQVTIYDIKLIKYKYPKLTIEVTCSSGTYIRSLARDLGQTLHTGAYVSALQRTEIGQFDISQSIQLNKINSKNLSKQLIPPSKLVSHLPRLTLSNDNVAQLIQGQVVEWGSEPHISNETHPTKQTTKKITNQSAIDSPIAIFNQTNFLVAIAHYNPNTSLLYPDKTFPSST